MGGRGGSSGIGSGQSLRSVMNNPPDLTGSEKQVSWANDIRDRIIQQVRDEFTEAEKRQDANPFYSSGPSYDTLSNFARNEYRKLYNEVEQKYREGKKQGRDKKELYKEFNRNLKKQMEDMFKNILKTQTTAKWWIDRRNH